MPPQDDHREEQRPTNQSPGETGFLAAQQTREATSWMPWIVAAAVLVIGVVILVVAGGRGSAPSTPANAGMAPADPYAGSLVISDLQMSEATSFSGAKVTYVDGRITNRGSQTIRNITVQVGFHSETGEYAQRLSFPLSLIRTREPYIDTQPVSAAPIAPGESREFRLIFDAVPPEWNQQYPEIRVISVQHT